MTRFSFRSFAPCCPGGREKEGGKDVFKRRLCEVVQMRPRLPSWQQVQQRRRLHSIVRLPRMTTSTTTTVVRCRDTPASSFVKITHMGSLKHLDILVNNNTHGRKPALLTSYEKVSSTRLYPSLPLFLASTPIPSSLSSFSCPSSFGSFSSSSLSLPCPRPSTLSKSSSCSPPNRLPPPSLPASVQIFSSGWDDPFPSSLHSFSTRLLSSSSHNKKKKKDKPSSKEEGKKEDKKLRRVLRVLGGGDMSQDGGESDFDASPSSSSHSHSRRGEGRSGEGKGQLHRGSRSRERYEDQQGDEDEDRSSNKREEKPAFDLKEYEKSMAAAIAGMVQRMCALVSTREKIYDFEKIHVSVAGEKRPLSDLAQVVMRGSTAVSVHVFSEANVPKVISALRAADSKWTIQEEAHGTIKCQLPKMTTEMREELRTKARAFLTAAKSEVRNLRQAGRSQLHKLQFKAHAIDETKRRELDVGLTNLMEAYVTKCDKVFTEKFQEMRLGDSH
ncbi:ribosome recycling factor protein [Cystoisospora suis]|uniref:Ribosome recycling factor protein n=1 Tax=Cystoisospora suis TaxID=483139 RepID=A0A2C6KYZ7_9APIC|nr:ribosome recycling factor protein [Cystoisospora suis]